MKILFVILACLAILILTTIIGIIVAIQIDVYFFKDLKKGEKLDYLPEKIVKLETEFKGGGGIHFLGESGKLYHCDQNEKTCETVIEPEKFTEKVPFQKTDALYPKFAEPPTKIKETVINQSRGLMSHHTERQYALLEDGTVWFWFFSGNELGESFPMWHIEHWLTIFLGVFGGLIFGLILSIFVWLKFVPRS